MTRTKYQPYSYQFLALPYAFNCSISIRWIGGKIFPMWKIPLKYTSRCFPLFIYFMPCMRPCVCVCVCMQPFVNPYALHSSDLPYMYLKQNETVNRVSCDKGKLYEIHSFINHNDNGSLLPKMTNDIQFYRMHTSHQSANGKSI